MRPEHPRHQVAAYLHGELTPAERSAFEAALAADPDLRAQVEQGARVFAVLGLLPAHPAPVVDRGALFARLRAEAGAERQPSPQPLPARAVTVGRGQVLRRLARVCAAAAAVLVAVAAGLLYFQVEVAKPGAGGGRVARTSVGHPPVVAAPSPGVIGFSRGSLNGRVDPELIEEIDIARDGDAPVDFYGDFEYFLPEGDGALMGG
ncbi:MAG: hypothetical protein HY719_06440 [Planctomycetes bacterium]|nr:hypothetical protein [Planctomycetota bacterium]